MRKFTLVLLVAWIPFVVFAAEDPVASEMVDGARQFLQSLSNNQNAPARFAFDDDERKNWHFVPRERAGLSLKVMSPAQRLLAQRLLATGLSSRGMQKALDIMYLEQVLFEKERSAVRDTELYFVTVFGEPSTTGDWGFRVEGHHLSLNVSLRDGKLQSTAPLFMGANPAEVREGDVAGMRALAEEEALGRALLLAFDETRRRSIVINETASGGIVTGASKTVELGNPEGLAFGAMDATQQGHLLDLVELYANRLRPEIAGAELARIEQAGHEGIHFAWAGGDAPGEGHYYRIQGPTFLIEYDNTQNDANHIHSVWRDLTGDFGDSSSNPLTAHYATSPHHQGRATLQTAEDRP